MNQINKNKTIITAKNSNLNITSDILKSKDLIYLLVKRDFITFYKQTILGPIWFIIQPILTTIVFTVIFGKVAKVPTDGIPPFLFYMAGVVPWMYFSSCLEKTSNTFLENSGIFGKVYFPRLVIPISIILSNLINFLIQFCIFIIFLFYFIDSSISPNIYILLSPFLILQIAVLGMGVGILISALTIKYRDITFILGFLIQLWMYASPIVYPLSKVPENWKWAMSLNPMTNIIETFRFMFLGQGHISFQNFLISLFFTLIVFFLGIYYFSKSERNFVDTV